MSEESAWAKVDELQDAIIQALRELHDKACDNERDHPAYANATWDAIDRIRDAVDISDEQMWPAENDR